MDYDSFINSLPAFHLSGKSAYKASLDTTLALDSYFNHPHTQFKTIHIGGTNGKGSVSNMLASVLQEAGYKTGLYTSPHLYDFRERIRIDGKMIEKKEVEDFLEKHHRILEELKPSFFEMTVAMAFYYFAKQKVDIAIVEVGMGGRLDSTNIITPLLSVITNIGLEHTQFLGNTIEKIAGEKAGIIKSGTPVIIGETDSATQDVFIRKANEMDSDISFADNNYHCQLSKWDNNSAEREYIISSPINNTYLHGKIPLCGDYQQKNLQTVTAAYNLLKNHLNLSAENLTNGISNVIINTGFAGRWEVINNSPLTICDAGHNRHGINEIVKQLSELHKEKLHCILGFSEDKDFDAILPLFPTNAVYYFTNADNPRACKADNLKQKASKYGLQGKSYNSLIEAYNAAHTAATKNDVIFIGGSIFLIAEIPKLSDCRL